MVYELEENIHVFHEAATTWGKFLEKKNMPKQACFFLPVQIGCLEIDWLIDYLWVIQKLICN